MLHDARLPPSFCPAATLVERNGVAYTSARWSAAELARLAASLDRRSQQPSTVDGAALLDAWLGTVEEFRDPRSPVSIALRPALRRLCGLSASGLDAALEAVLGGVTGEPAREILSSPPVDGRRGLATVVLAGNLPALFVQPLLPALALRRPVLLKSPSSEPLFAPVFVDRLLQRLPALEGELAAVTWPGGDDTLEPGVLESSALVLAYGNAAAIDDLRERCGNRLLPFGPRASVAVVGSEAFEDDVFAGLAADIALFDQRGCLCVQAVYTDGPAREVADRLASALELQAAAWPPGEVEPVTAAAVQQVRIDARLRGLYQPPLDLVAGTVLVEPLPGFAPSPGLRTVRIQPVSDLSSIPDLLQPHAPRLQGAALAGKNAWELAPALEALGLSRVAPPGELQSADALWHNGGLHPLAALAGGGLPEET